jgi:hypothetical protein
MPSAIAVQPEEEEVDCMCRAERKERKKTFQDNQRVTALTRVSMAVAPVVGDPVTPWS